MTSLKEQLANLWVDNSLLKDEIEEKDAEIQKLKDDWAFEAKLADGLCDRLDKAEGRLARLKAHLEERPKFEGLERNQAYLINPTDIMDWFEKALELLGEEEKK